MQPEKRKGGAVTGQPDPFRDLGDHPDPGEALPLPWHQQHTGIAASVVERQGDRHPGKYHCVV